MAVDLFSYESYRAWLRDWFEDENLKRKEQGRIALTHRRFHEEAGLGNPGTLIQITEYERRLTPALLNAFLTPLGLTPGGREHRYLLGLIDLEKARKQLEAAAVAAAKADRDQEALRDQATPADRRRVRRNAEVRARALHEAREAESVALAGLRALRDLERAERLEGQLPEILASLVSTAVYELSRCPDFRREPAWIADHLRIQSSLAEVETALEALEVAGRLGGERAKVLKTPESVPAAAVRAYYEAAHGASGEALAAGFGPDRLAEQPRQRLGALTAAIPAAQIPAFRDLLLRLQNEVASFLQGLEGQPDVVYQLYLHLFPVSAVVQEDPGDSAAVEGSDDIENSELK